MAAANPVIRRRALFLILLSGAIAAGAIVRAQTPEAAQAPAEKSAVLEKARYFGQCEIFLLKGRPGSYEALVYNTTPLNDCPPAQFDPIDTKVLAQRTGSDLAWKNPRRFWTMDAERGVAV